MTATRPSLREQAIPALTDHTKDEAGWIGAENSQLISSSFKFPFGLYTFRTHRHRQSGIRHIAGAFGILGGTVNDSNFRRNLAYPLWLAFWSLAVPVRTHFASNQQS